MNSRVLPICAAALSLFLSCTKEVEFSGTQKEAVPVLFSAAIAGESVTMTLSLSLFFLEEEFDWEFGYNPGYYLDLAGKRIEASLFVGGVRYPFSLEYSPIEDKGDGFREAQFHYVADYSPRAGDRLEYKVNIEGYGILEGETTVPPAPVFEIKHWSEDGGSYDATIQLDDRGEGRLYYMVCEPFYTTDMLTLTESSVFSNETFQGKKFSFSVSGYNNVGQYAEQPVDSEDFGITMLSLSESLYKYESTRSLLDSFLSFVGESVHLYSNVRGGIGCIGAMNFSSKAFLPLE